MATEVSLLQRCLNQVKSTVFEKGQLIYRAHIPTLRRQLQAINARWRERPQGDVVRVGLLMQIPQNWVLLGPLYQTALRMERIEPVVLLVPSLQKSHYVQITGIDWQEVYDFGQQHAAGHCVQTYDPQTGTWVDPATLKLDYVFMVRPYETYLPKDYSALGLSRHAKVCYCPYAFTMTDDDWPVEYNSHFMRSVSLVFADRLGSVDYVRRQFAQTVNSGLQKVFYLGYPGLDGIEGHRGAESAIWPRQRQEGDFRIIWAPRWTIDPRMGGGHFFDYKEQMIALAEHDPSVVLAFRPHPLALAHYVQQGWISQEDEDAYLARYDACANAAVDQTREYYDTFFSSDVLITDFSSMVFGYFFTDKPIIYCEGTLDHLMNEEGLMDSMYLASSFEDIKRYLDMFRRGEDPKRELRRKMAERFNSGDGASTPILLTLLQDFDEGRMAGHAGR